MATITVPTMGSTATARPEGVYDVASRIGERLEKIAACLDDLDKKLNGDIPQDMPEPGSKLPGPLPLSSLVQRIEGQVSLIENQCLRINATIGV